MKLDTQDRNVRRSGSFPESTFKIAANAKAFDILSSKLYTDTRLAIVRELSTNAWDSQVEAGTQETPFLVHLPNSFAPYFSIRDYGTGLSPDQVESIYTTYFASTRNESNDFVGALGLGSKSPFAYTDQFTVTSYWNGMAYSYSAFKNENGEPSIALLSEEPTDEPNGVEIRINVRENDGYEFQAAAQRVYRFFPVRPKIVGMKVEFSEEKPRFEGQGYALYDQNAGLPGRINVVMGNICYPVEGHYFSHVLGNDARLVLFVSIGEVEFAASREELHYSESTIKNLQDRMTTALREVSQEIEKALSQHICLIEKIKDLRGYRNLIEFSYSAQSIPIEVANTYSLKRVELRGDKLFIGRDQWQHELNPGAGTNYIIIENDIEGDLKQGHKNALRHFLRSQPQRGVFYLAKIEDRQKFAETFGIPSAVLSTLPDAPKAARVGYSGPRTYIKVVKSYRRHARDQWDNVEGDVDITDAIAVPRKNSMVIIAGQEYTGATALEIAQQMGYKVVYGIAQAYYDRIRQQLGLLDLEQEAREYTQEFVDNMDPYVLARMQHGFDIYKMPSEFLKWISGMSDTCDNLVKLSKADPVDHTLTSMIVMLAIAPPVAPDYHQIFSKAYPLISSIELRHVNKNDVLEYITLKS